MDTKEKLVSLCHEENGALKPKNECRALMINHLILEDGLDIDAAEDLTDKTLNETGYWPMPKFDWDTEDPTESPKA
jgi:hypothetical protein